MDKLEYILKLIAAVIIVFALTVISVSAGTYLHNKNKTIFGDINSDGVINDEDIYYIKGHLLKRWQLTKEEYFRADMNQDGNITSLDVVLIRMAIKEKEK